MSTGALRRFLCMICLVGSFYATAQPDSSRLRVGVAEAMPYAMQDEQGNWTGLAIEFWQRVAQREGVAYELIPLTGRDSLLPLVGDRIDLLLEAPITANGTRTVDYLHPYHQTTLAVAKSRQSDILQVAKNVFSLQFLQIILYLSVLLVIVGTAVYFLERKNNGEQFGGERTLAQGIGSGFWWAGVTLTTIGYGDKAPTTLGGRIVAMLWMLTALAITASLTATVVSALNQGSKVSFPDELREHTVGVTEATKSAAYLGDQNLDVRPYDDAEAGLRGLMKGDVDYFVDNETSIRYALLERRSLAANVQATDRRPQAFAIAVERGSPLGDSLRAATIAVALSGSWRSTLEDYGAQP